MLSIQALMRGAAPRATMDWPCRLLAWHSLLAWHHLLARHDLLAWHHQLALWQQSSWIETGTRMLDKLGDLAILLACCA